MADEHMAKYKIKEKPEDFIVREITTIKPAKEGQYSYFLLKKTNLNVMDAVRRISDFLGIPLKNVGFAGTKDKVAVTEQNISVRGGFEERLSNLRSEGIELTFLGKGDSPISLGDLEGNGFEIVVRDAGKEPKKLSMFINYFGEQRFSQNNAEVGKAMIKGDFKKACEIMKENAVDAYLKSRPNDHPGALKQLPMKILTLYINAYQSSLWNSAVDEYLKKNKQREENLRMPVIGFGTEFNDPKTKEICEKIMKNESITTRDFIVRKMPELSSEGTERDVFAVIKDLSIEKIGDMAYMLKFSLKKGCYATEAIRQMFEE